MIRSVEYYIPQTLVMNNWPVNSLLQYTYRYTLSHTYRATGEILYACIQ